MNRLGFGTVLLCLAFAGCSKQPQAATTAPGDGPPVAAVPVQTTGGPSAAQDEPAPEPEDPNRPWIAADTASDYMLIGDGQQRFGVFVDVPRNVGAHVPTALALAVDTSGSMRGEKIVHAREAARRLVRELEDGDIVSLVAFSNRAQLAVSPTVIDSHTRRDILNVIEELGAEGGTAMHHGLQLAESQMWHAPDSHLVRRVVVISDGKATVGPKSASELGGLAETGLQHGIQVTAVGVGLDYDELTLNELAVRSSGRLYHVEESIQLAAIVEEEIGLIQATAAADVTVELVAAPGVRLLGTDTSHARMSAGSLFVPLGTMFGGQKRELLVNAHVDDQGREGEKVIASVRLHFRDATQGGLERVQETILRGIFTDDPRLVQNTHNSRTQTLIAVREASTFTQQASQQLNAGDLDAADRDLGLAQARLEKQARMAKNEKDRRRAADSASKVQVQRAKVRKAKKKKGDAKAKASRSLSLEANADTMDALGY